MDMFLSILRSSSFTSKKGAGAFAATGFVLGILFGFGLALFFFSTSAYDLGLFLVFMAFFHMSEFVFAATFHPTDLSTDSFLLPHDHSPEFAYAILAAFVEYLVEWFFFPQMKGTFLMWIGFLIAAAGQAVRLLALFTARHNFTHQISFEKKPEHKLVTEGIYSIFRHPGYFGWYWWAVGTQLVIFNPFCFVAYAVVAQKFFKDRIQDEELELSSKRFFGAQYHEYKARVPTWIPMIP